MVSRALRATLVAGSVLFATPVARAQGASGVALDQLDPAPPGDRFYGVPSPFARGELSLAGLVLFDYGHRPLELPEDGGAVVGTQGFLHVGAALAIRERLLVSALLPIALLQGGDDPTLRGDPIASPSSTEIGDLRIGARVRIAGSEEDAIALAASAAVHLPTGAEGSYAGDGAIRLSPQLVLGGRLDVGVPVVWSAFGGAMVRGSDYPSAMTYGAGAAVLLWDERLQLGPEAFAATPLREGSLEVSPRRTLPAGTTTNAELLIGVRARAFGPLWFGAAAGPGLSDAIGTPAFRAVGSIAWAPEPERGQEPGPADADADGLLDPVDACPYAYGPAGADPKRSGCPIVDDDEDGIPNSDDVCPDRPAPAAGGDPARRGCPAPPPPPDADADGIPDAADACPTEAGAPAEDPAIRGCPVAATGDVDGDGIPDVEDACPREKGGRGMNPSEHGCPKFARVHHGEEIMISAPIEFRVAKSDPAPIHPASIPALEEVRDVILQHPEWLKLEVQAHTDSAGNAKYNDDISAARAEAVRRWLVDHGVAAERVVAKGYGASKPIADNSTAAGREKNRRVQVMVIDKK